MKRSNGKNGHAVRLRGHRALSLTMGAAWGRVAPVTAACMAGGQVGRVMSLVAGMALLAICVVPLVHPASALAVTDDAANKITGAGTQTKTAGTTSWYYRNGNSLTMVYANQDLDGGNPNTPFESQIYLKGDLGAPSKVWIRNATTTGPQLEWGTHTYLSDGGTVSQTGTGLFLKNVGSGHTDAVQAGNGASWAKMLYENVGYDSNGAVDVLVTVGHVYTINKSNQDPGYTFLYSQDGWMQHYTAKNYHATQQGNSATLVINVLRHGGATEYNDASTPATWKKGTTYSNVYDDGVHGTYASGHYTNGFNDIDISTTTRQFPEAVQVISGLSSRLHEGNWQPASSSYMAMSEASNRPNQAGRHNDVFLHSSEPAGLMFESRKDLTSVSNSSDSYDSGFVSQFEVKNARFTWWGTGCGTDIWNPYGNNPLKLVATGGKGSITALKKYAAPAMTALNPSNSATNSTGSGQATTTLTVPYNTWNQVVAQASNGYYVKSIAGNGLQNTYSGTDRTVGENKNLILEGLPNNGTTVTATFAPYTLTINYYTSLACTDLKTGTSYAKGAKLGTSTFNYDGTNLASYGLNDYLSDAAAWHLSAPGYHGSSYWRVGSVTGEKTSASTTYATVQQAADALTGTSGSMNTKNVTVNLYTDWTENTLTINYYSNGPCADAMTGTVYAGNTLLNSATYGYSNTTAFSSYGLSNADGGAWRLKRDGYLISTNPNYWLIGSGTASKKISADDTYAGTEKMAEALLDSNGIKEKSRTVNLYALWVKSPTVSFDMNGQGAQVPAQTVASGSAPTKPANPTSKNWEFAGWYTSDAFSTAYDFTKAVTADTVVHAKWVPHAWSVQVPTLASWRGMEPGAVSASATLPVSVRGWTGAAAGVQVTPSVGSSTLKPDNGNAVGKVTVALGQGGTALKFAGAAKSASQLPTTSQSVVLNLSGWTGSSDQWKGTVNYDAVEYGSTSLGAVTATAALSESAGNGKLPSDPKAMFVGISGASGNGLQAGSELSAVSASTASSWTYGAENGSNAGKTADGKTDVVYSTVGQSGYTVTVPCAITYTGRRVGPVDVSCEFPVKVQGVIVGGQKLAVTVVDSQMRLDGPADASSSVEVSTTCLDEGRTVQKTQNGQRSGLTALFTSSELSNGAEQGKIVGTESSWSASFGGNANVVGTWTGTLQYDCSSVRG